MKSISERITFWVIRLITLDYYVIRGIIKKYRGKPSSVLDLGCGNGHLAPLFAPRSYIGVEVDEKLVTQAKKEYPKYEFIGGDATRLRLNRKFDLIVVIGVLHHLSSKGFVSTLKIINMHLKHSGKALIVEAIPPLSPINIFGKLIRQLDKGSFIRSFAGYKTKMEKDFNLEVAKTINGGVVDYALFVLGKK